MTRVRPWDLCPCRPSLGLRQQWPRTESCPLPWGHEGQIPGSGGSGGKGGGAGDRGGNRDMEGWEQQVREEQGEEGSRISAGEDPSGR